MTFTGFLFFFAACKKEDNYLPAPTHKVANTFACKINGKKFYLAGKTTSSNPLGVFFGGGGGSTSADLSIFANAKDTYISIDFADPGTQYPASSKLIKKEQGKAEVYLNGGITVPNDTNYYSTDETIQGK